MYKLSTLAILPTCFAFLIPVALAAEATDPAQSNKASNAATALNAETEQRLTVTTLRNETVLATTETKPSAETFPVIDKDGNVYYNHIIKLDNLPTVQKDIDVVDTYSFVHDGVTYTNKIVE